MNTAKEFQVVRRLGTGSYAVVYLVREVMSRPPSNPVSDDGHVGILDLDLAPPKPMVYGRNFALKVLSKANLDATALTAQLSEVTIHQSLAPHPNIVTLHRTLETDAFLLLVLEYVPGEDLFYFLEQARDHYAPVPSGGADDSLSSVGIEGHTPPTPSLLATLHPSALLSHTRLRLIASMFSQMCDAVAACHDQQVFHRDIKPENFIVTDGYISTSTSPSSSEPPRMERKVLVKLTDFGLSTTEQECADMDCGSAPYMSFECRNNVSPTYSPERSDVWSLGIVLINMQVISDILSSCADIANDRLYHYNPWTDTSDGVCSSFSLFRAHGAHFFMQRFTGMTLPVAEFLTQRVFVLPPFDSSHMPVTAKQFGAWVKDLPALLSDRENTHKGHKRHLSTASSTLGHPLSSCPPSRRPSSRAAMRTPLVCSRSLSRAPSVGGVLVEEPEDLSREHVLYPPEGQEHLDVDNEHDEDGRSRSTKKRGKRGSRKGGQKSTTDETLETLAVASQSLAREISLANRGTSRSSSFVGGTVIDLSRNASRTSSLAHHASTSTPVAVGAQASPPLENDAPRAAVVTKKPSKWKLGFGGGKNVVPTPSEETIVGTASNVTNVIMGLSQPTPHAQSSNPYGRKGSPLDSRSSVDMNSSTNVNAVRSPHTPLTRQRSPADTASTWARGRPPGASSTFSSAFASSVSPGTHSGVNGSVRGNSPPGSVRSSNWRSSMSSASTSTSAFTRYSNSSTRSVSTTATSVSNGSWRTGQSQAQAPHILNNVKSKLLSFPWSLGAEMMIIVMDGVPWELAQLPRQLHPNPVGDIFGQPPPRKSRTRKSKLDTISERPTPLRDAATSTTDLSGGGGGDEDTPKKVQKGQINALAKMLSALKR